MSEYNGWTNYATWRINLEFFHDCEGTELASNWERISLQEQVEVAQNSLLDFIDENTSNVFVNAWIREFVADVNFYEIVKHINEQA